MEDFEEIKALVLHYLRGIWKNRWISIAIAWPIMIGGVLFVDQLTDRYSAETKVYIDSTSVLKPLLKGLAIQSDFESAVKLMVRKLLSRPNLERAARIMDMDIHINSPKEMEELITKIRERVNISAKNKTGTYNITYQDENRQRAKKMVQTLLDIFVEDTLGKSVNESDSAIAFLDKQIDKYEQLLQEAENRRESFKRKNVGLMPKDGANYYSDLQQVKSELEDAVLQLQEATNRRNKISSKLDQFSDLEVEADTASAYDGRIMAQEAKLDELLLLYTEEHPDVKNVQRVLDSLKERKQKELENNKMQTRTISASDNPVYQELEILLTTTDADISSLNARVTSLKRKVLELKERVDIVPKIEAELQRLNRDYDVHKKNYTELVERREQARISEEVQSGTEQVKFRIIEPPYVPLKASFPNRPLFDGIVILFSLAVGYGIGLLISLFQPVFYNINDVKKYIDLPILGAISKYDTEAVLRKRRRNLLLFISANLIFLLFGLLLAFMHSREILIFSILQSKVFGL